MLASSFVGIHSHRIRFVLLAVGVLPFVSAFVAVGALTGVGCVSPASGGEGADAFDFDRHVIDLGIATRPTVLPGFFTGGSLADFAVVHQDEEGERHLRVFSFGGEVWTPSVVAKLEPDTAFIDVVRIGERDRVLVYTPGHVRWFDLDQRSLKSLARVTSTFTPPRVDEVPHVDITRDVNGDGLDDLVVPGKLGFWISVQSAGAFEPPVQVGDVPGLSRILWPDGYRYDPWGESRIHLIDYDHDGRSDLVFWNGEGFDVHLQEERGTFARRPLSFTTRVHFDSDDLSWFSTVDKVGRVLRSLSDVNGDGVGDLVIQELEGRGIANKRSSYQIHFGDRAADTTEFASEADLVFASEDGIHIAWDQLDVDGDGDLDLALTTIERRFLETSLWKRLKGAMGDDVWLKLELYPVEDGEYAREPARLHRIALDGAPSHTEPGSVPLDLVLRGGKHAFRRTQTEWPRAFNPTVRIGDITSDGRPDLIVEQDHHTLAVYVGVPEPQLFARHPRPYRTAVPTDEEYVRLADLNQDGRQDLLLHHPFLAKDVHGGRKKPPGTEPHRLVVLLSR